MRVRPEDIDRAVGLLLDSGVVAFPTETVYGLGALSSDDAAVERVFEIKGRPRGRALIVHLAQATDMDEFAVDIPDYARKLAKDFWPGPLTLVFPRAASVPDAVTGGGDTVAVRVPDHPVALELIARLTEQRGSPSGIAAPSANKFGEPPATTAQDVIATLGIPGRDEGGPDMVLDGGQCPGKIHSTIISCVTDVPRLLRRGAVTPQKVEESIGRWLDR